MTYVEPANLTSITDLMSYANTASGNIYGIGILISLYVIIFMYLNSRGEETENAFAVAGYITAFVAIFIFMMGLITSWHLFIAISTAVMPLIWSYINKD